MSINIRGELYDLKKPAVMGIVNVTPDSFYAGSRTFTSELIKQHIDKMMADGADMLDFGGYSSRPGADNVSADEEYRRLALGLEILRRDYPNTIVSVDTFRADVARRCVEDWNVEIINDISGGDLDSAMWETVADLKVPYIMMHMRGTPATMQSHCDYNDVTADVIVDLVKKIDKLQQLGVNDIIIDPGFGFSKTLEQNYRLMAELDEFKKTGYPILVGISHKSMIYKALNTTPDNALTGTIILNTIALTKGADILRVHDVKEAVECVKLHEILKANTPK